MAVALPAGYDWQLGHPCDRTQLLDYLQASVRESLGSASPLGHLSSTLDRFLSRETPIWWVVTARDRQIVGGLWAGRSQEQRRGDRQTHVFLVYVEPSHRRRGLATALLMQAEEWARAQGDRGLSLQVYADNPGAIALYQRAGFSVESLNLSKPL
ncbi:GNAT family N-acetyltransferase [Synechococcus elongatus]|uniref:N-acetyltransferase domain-containing protein n=2 Tax=Synechococcus elongatus TaxID=32046 RepID=Q31MD6_SYNE7|nr:GNAT family N-acetyltransferase [Synechococcus elongatus]MBD2687573.1 GNAT family N-acetyltransferase [Synechococcus elongatus FACHB-1061]ABB57783.1 conserved hypothetical protein [Synechococcus elongatus PCC 7942 = FACHB-805]AJD57729.1 hypothetical protein M744_07715 [Synechococcus elongatus UTEX 2973]MBD2586499.1 GNAT family N-acetyltransferase [Synechococcus elongatus FACHB-242]MBD2706718.1 GNAT family N-acetyltransferase [Synechococcus elongatus PCC 7942 = FACHB-805]